MQRPNCCILHFLNFCQPVTWRLLECFTGTKIVAEVAQTQINDPCNAFNIQGDAHYYFYQLAWGIEAQEQIGEVSRLVFLRPYPKSSFNSLNIYTVLSAINSHIQFLSKMEMKSYFATGRKVF